MQSIGPSLDLWHQPIPFDVECVDSNKTRALPERSEPVTINRDRHVLWRCRALRLSFQGK